MEHKISPQTCKRFTKPSGIQLKKAKTTKHVFPSLRTLPIHPRPLLPISLRPPTPPSASTLGPAPPPPPLPPPGRERSKRHFLSAGEWRCNMKVPARAAGAVRKKAPGAGGNRRSSLTCVLGQPWSAPGTTARQMSTYTRRPAVCGGGPRT